MAVTGPDWFPGDESPWTWMPFSRAQRPSEGPIERMAQQTQGVQARTQDFARDSLGEARKARLPRRTGDRH